ncbi:MAG: hypothetical protein GF349_04220 [Candidatus Magasanikbacteria bacterium]|nr:hypothetical protein [Candidatus Magasanikbacteria bacterium]
MFKQFSASLIKEIKDLIFPIFCIECGKESSWLCKVCFEKINFEPVFICPVCRCMSTDGFTCVNCINKSNLIQQISLCRYEENALSGKIIKILKYNYAIDIQDLIRIVFKNFYDNYTYLFKDFDYIVPIPLHHKRRAERGFNQAEVLSNIVSFFIGVPVNEILIRRKKTKQQARLGRKERIENLDKAFSIKKNVDLTNKKILLVDDVYTTGVTMQEAAFVLKKQNCQKIVGFSFARA